MNEQEAEDRRVLKAIFQTTGSVEGAKESGEGSPEPRTLGVWGDIWLELGKGLVR